MAKHSFNKTVWQCLTLISQFGIMMLVPTGMMFALGYWLDGRLGTQFFAVVLFPEPAGPSMAIRIIKSPSLFSYKHFIC